MPDEENMARRVVVTGVGLVSCLGHDYETVLEYLRNGRSGVRKVPDEWLGRGLKSLVAGTIDNVQEKTQASGIPKKLLPGMSDAALYCTLAAKDAVADAGWSGDELQDPGTACIVGSGVGSVDAVYQAAHLYFSDRMRRIDPYTVLRCMSSSSSAAVANVLKIRGRSYSLSAACATSAHSIGHAVELLRAGLAERAVAGGGEDVTELIAVAFQALRLALSTHYNDTPARASRPYDANRDGFVLSGGAGIVTLETLESARRRGRRIYGEIIGYAANSEGFDMVLPDPQGRQSGACMRSALDNAGIAPGDVDYVNTHGTSTLHGDMAEVHAMQQVFGARLPRFSSTKSLTGHPIGAAGALELIFCLGMMEKGFVAPSINIETPDPAIEGLPVATDTVICDLDTVMSNSFGFGGTNAALVLRKTGD